MGAIDDELRRLEDVPMISLENFMRFRGGDDADQYSLGVFHPINDRVLVHAMATTTKNGENAAYKGVDYAHGDKLATLANRDPWSVSLVAQLKF